MKKTNLISAGHAEIKHAKITKYVRKTNLKITYYI
jgi:hypothetical protein